MRAEIAHSGEPKAALARCFGVSTETIRKWRKRGTPFRWVNTTLGNIKTAIAGTYHHVSSKHAQSYLTSFAYRFNRRYQLDSIVERLTWAAVHTIPQPYRVIVADA